MNGDKEEAKLGLLLVIPLITVTHLYGLNALWISHRMVRTVTITSKSLTSPWGDKGSRSRSNSTICQVEVPSYRNSRQSIVTELPCGLWTSAQPGVTQLKIETQIGITGIEFAEVL